MEHTLTCMCVDDEPLAIEVLKKLIAARPELKLTATAANAMEAMEKLRKEPVDLIFCDINMPEVNGLEFARSIQDTASAFIFTTAHPEFAVDAFELEALDYLTKPVSPERFEKAVQKAQEYFELRRNKKVDKVELEEGHIFVKTDSKLLKIGFGDILYVEAFADYVKIWISEEKRIVTLQTMKKMEQGLPAEKFIRIHRSFIIALDKIQAVAGNNVIIAGKSIPIGKNYRDAFMQLIAGKKLGI
ncbi:MAG: LytTR family DNA-binding domain-containing protein [Bacteroidetes bacterium]|nr:LytTR family DNA-binding domain-containing protein [Bacteroidota bacterium]